MHFCERGGSMIYLASPYSHPNVNIREARYRSVCRATAMLLEAGHSVFSPIVHGHPLAEYGLPTDWAFWQRYDRDHLTRCDELVVLTLDGWRESIGVTAEVALAVELGKPVRYLEPATLAPTSPTLARVAKEVVS